MPRNLEIKSGLVLGAGPIVIGQACEFDYSGTQACQVLRDEGYKVILVNSNPATIMTDPATADVTYAPGSGTMTVHDNEVATLSVTLPASADELASAIRKGLSAPLRTPAPLPEAIVVGRGARANCLSVRVALRQIQPGGRITVLPGTYKEAILVDKEVTIQGEGDSSEVQFPAGITVAPGRTLTLARITAGNDQGLALRLMPGARAEAEDACFQGGLAGGVELGPGTEGRFLRCRFIDNGSAGMLALEGALAFLEDCELGGNQDAGLHACRDSGIQFRCCRLVGNRGMGVSAVDGASVALDRCEVARNQGPGVLLHRGGTGRLDHC